MPNPNINWGGAQAVLCNVVAAFGVDNTGATDAGPNLATAFADLAASGQVPWLRSGTYEVTTAAPPAAGQPVWVQPGVTFTGANAASVANVALVYGEAPGTPAYNPAWYALTDIYWDPVSGLDTNTGEVGSPLLTFAEIVRRWGSDSPTYPNGQSFEVHKLSAQPAGIDPVFCTPNLSGGGYAALVDTLQLVHAAFVAGTVTPLVQGAPGNLWKVAGMPGGTAANQYIYNQTRNSYAFIRSAAIGVATISQPIKGSVVTTIARPSTTESVNEDNTWATGDTLVLYTASALNLKRWCPIAADVSGSGQMSLGWVQWSQIVDTSGAGISQYQHGCATSANVLMGCLVSTSLAMSSDGASPLSVPANGAMICNCAVVGQTGVFGNASGIIGCILEGGGDVYGTSEIGSNTILGGSWLFRASVTNLHSVFSDGLLSCYSSVIADTITWGSFNLTVGPGGTYWNASGSPFATNLQTSGTLALGNLTNIGSYYAPGIGLWVGAVPVTSANLDTYAGLADPQTGARYCVTNGGNTSQVTNLAALAALNSTHLLPGTQVYVQSPGAYWALLPTSAATPNGSTIIAAAAGGNWLLLSAFGAEPAIDATAFGVKGDGVTNDGPALSAAATDLAGTGITLAITKAASGSLTPTIFVQTSVLLQNNLVIRSGPGVTFLADVAGSAVTDALFLAQPTGSIGTTTLAANTVLGALTCSVTALVLSGGTIAVGMWIQLGNAPIGTIYRGAEYKVLSITGSGPYTIGLDRPIKFQFSAGDTVSPVTNIPQNIHFLGGGCTFTGTCQRYCEWVTARDCSIEDVMVNAQGGAAQNVIMSWDVGGYRSFYRRIRANGGGVPNWGLMIESGEACGIENCDVQYTSQSGTGVGYQLWDCVECTVDRSTSASHCLVGIALVSQDTVIERGCNYCRISGSYDANLNYGVFITLGTRECVIDDFTANYNGEIGVYLDGTGARMQSNVIANGQCISNVAYGIQIAPGAKATAISNVEVSNNGTYGVFASDDVLICNLSAYNTSVPTGAGQTSQTTLGVNNGAFCTVHGLSITDTQASTNYNVLTSVGTIAIDGAVIRIAPGNYGLVTLGTGVIKVARTTLLPVGSSSGEFGIAAAGTSTVRIGEGVDASACATPVDIVAGSFSNRFTQVLAGAASTVVSWPNLKSTDDVQLQIQSVAGTLEAPYKVTPNPGTGFTITPLGAAPSLDTSTLQVTIL